MEEQNPIVEKKAVEEVYANIPSEHSDGLLSPKHFNKLAKKAALDFAIMNEKLRSFQ